jgi:hypothetical protein
MTIFNTDWNLWSSGQGLVFHPENYSLIQKNTMNKLAVVKRTLQRDHQRIYPAVLMLMLKYTLVS